MAKTAVRDTGGCDKPRNGQGDEPELPLAERLKEQFGDYSDPYAYDWSWREGE